MKEGDKVVCVITGTGPHGEMAPVVGEIYTIRELRDFDGEPGVRLVEIVNQPNEYFTCKGRRLFEECSFHLNCFRPIDYSYGEKVTEEISKELIKEAQPCVVGE